jgi:outer membrane lipoprotein SlyB
VLGHAIERNATREVGQEIIVRLAGGERRAVVQAKGAEAFRPGDAVTLVTTAGRVRVTLDGRAPARGS